MTGAGTRSYTDAPVASGAALRGLLVLGADDDQTGSERSGYVRAMRYANATRVPW